MSEPLPAPDRVHGTLVAFQGRGVLLTGPSGAGKSDLALRLLGLGGDWRLVADDQVLLTAADDRVAGAAPAAIAGRIEVRGLGIIAMPFLPQATISAIVDLVPRERVPRLPDPDAHPLLGVPLPIYRLHAFDASTPAKIQILLRN